MQSDAAGSALVIPRSETREFIGADATNNLRMVFRSTGAALPIDSIWKHGAQPNAISAGMIGRSGKAGAAGPVGH